MTDSTFNTIISDDGAPVLHLEIDRVISAKGYKENFLPRLEEMVEKHGEIRLLVHYKDFKGWETEAAQLDMFFSATLGKNAVKLAMVNPPKAEVFQRMLKKDLIKGEIKLFNDADLEDALSWIAS